MGRLALDLTGDNVDLARQKSTYCSGATTVASAGASTPAASVPQPATPSRPSRIHCNRRTAGVSAS